MLPILIFRMIFFKKDIRIKEKLYLNQIDFDFNKKKIVWMHAVSLGEMKVGISFLKKLQQEFEFEFIITTQTKTGFDYAKSVYPKNVTYSLLDLFFLQKKFIKKINPNYFFLIETDFWPECLYQLKKHGVKTFLINGKMSDRSFSRLSSLSKLTKYMFRNIDHFFVQDDDNKEKFSKFIPIQKITVSGNLKLLKEEVTSKEDLSYLNEKRCLTLACTHPGEEKELFFALKDLIKKDIILIFAPRHPERFQEVYSFLKNEGVSVSFLTDKILTNCIIVNKMGVLNSVYSVTDLVIMGGSFSSKIGGHDIFEPIFQGVYTLFGPNMDSQKYFKNLAIKNGFGESVKIENLVQIVDGHFNNCLDKTTFLKKINKFKKAFKGHLEGFFISLRNQL